MHSSSTIIESESLGMFSQKVTIGFPDFFAISSRGLGKGFDFIVTSNSSRFSERILVSLKFI